MQGRSLGWIAVLGLVAGCQHISVSFDTQRACRADLEASFGLVERNYAGYADKLARVGEDAVARAQQAALRRVDAQDPAPCAEILNGWLAVFDEGHLGVAVASRESSRGAQSDAAPQFEILSEQTALLRVPSFEGAHRVALERLVSQHRDAILARPELVIDVRGNDGGNSSTFRVLAELAYARPVAMRGADVLSTPENIEAWKRMLPTLHADERRFMRQVIARMQEQPGEWVNYFADARYRRESSWPQPSRVAVLTDSGCGSACERFVLEVRQSPKVRVFGRSTAGNLDYANLRPHPLPSGQMLWVGTTRSHDLPHSAIDAIGLPPHVPMDPERFDGPTRAEALAEVARALRLPLGSRVTAER